MTELSVVIPTKNEEESIHWHLHRKDTEGV